MPVTDDAPVQSNQFQTQDIQNGMIVIRRYAPPANLQPFLKQAFSPWVNNGLSVTQDHHMEGANDETGGSNHSGFNDETIGWDQPGKTD